MLQAIKDGTFQALGVYGLLAFVGSLPSPVGFPLAIWTLPSLMVAFFLYEWAFGKRSRG